MWTIDAQCSRCKNKEACRDRTEVIKTLSLLASRLNTEDDFANGPGDGVLIVACKDRILA